MEDLTKMEYLLKKLESCDGFILLTINEDKTQGYIIDADVSENLTIEQVDELLIEIINNRKKL